MPNPTSTDPIIDLLTQAKNLAKRVEILEKMVKAQDQAIKSMLNNMTGDIR